ncbi:uncharacterized protein SPAPADRAFT_133325 [Spathaspora passalidarum NRRL Y-27907]|uniref:Uncharacterized protein n=1 Tax=Spathaspora passalidarum (strain NRRL Y-27907 / 11-Y1) TaxID=619300 RepID=G3AI41_SPAPN|nr:uncharacterized protein SPAPADRAFT_133325 [Spathaspora passalidarum NRRL Y-27907]EGW34356.1 hypothetical protein SPAPADRAFT_133325 [Spathaspora passalidarum NRRL Y-27907]
MTDTIDVSVQETEVKIDLKKDERFHMYPKDRIYALVVTSAIVGAGVGFYDGIKLASLRYLIENGHRLPTTVGGWYFYHKKKNYVMLVSGVKSGAYSSLKYSAVIGCFFGLEYLLDWSRNSIDFINTTCAAAVLTSTYVATHQLSARQSKKLIFRGTAMGLGLGLMQDFLISQRRGRIWYLEKLGFNSQPKLQA